MADTPICDINVASDVEVLRDGSDYKIRFQDGSPWHERFNTADALRILITLREAGYKVPQHITTQLAKSIVQRTFNSGLL